MHRKTKPSIPIFRNHVVIIQRLYNSLQNFFKRKEKTSVGDRQQTFFTFRSQSLYQMPGEQIRLSCILNISRVGTPHKTALSAVPLVYKAVLAFNKGTTVGVYPLILAVAL